jgi:hypothetical protein
MPFDCQLLLVSCAAYWQQCCPAYTHVQVGKAFYLPDCLRNQATVHHWLMLSLTLSVSKRNTLLFGRTLTTLSCIPTMCFCIIPAHVRQCQSHSTDALQGSQLSGVPMKKMWVRRCSALIHTHWYIHSGLKLASILQQVCQVHMQVTYIGNLPYPTTGTRPRNCTMAPNSRSCPSCAKRKPDEPPLYPRTCICDTLSNTSGQAQQGRLWT